MACEKCSESGPEGKSHYHIIIERGRVTAVWFVSGDGYWDRKLEKDEYIVEYVQERTERCGICDRTYPASEIVKHKGEQLCFSCYRDKYPIRDKDIPY